MTSPFLRKKFSCGERIMTYGMARFYCFSLFLLVLHYFVAETVCKSNTHDATLKIGVILSPLHPRGGATWVNFCWVCAAGLSEPLPHYRPHVSHLWANIPQIPTCQNLLTPEISQMCDPILVTLLAPVENATPL